MSDFSYVNKDDLPSLTIDQMNRIYELLNTETRISQEHIVEIAGIQLARMVRYLFKYELLEKTILVFAGKGLNGAVVLSAVKHLFNNGCEIDTILTTTLDKLNKITSNNFQILNLANASIGDIYDISLEAILELVGNSDLVIDGIIGTGIKNDPQEPIADIIDFINKSANQVLAFDMPTGLNGDIGVGYEPTIKASQTMTLALPKNGQTKKNAAQYIGDLYVADIAVPQTIYEKLGIEVPLFFDKHEIVKIV